MTKRILTVSLVVVLGGALSTFAQSNSAGVKVRASLATGSAKSLLRMRVGEVDWDEGRVHLPVLIGRGVRLRRGASAGPFAALGSGAILEERSSVSRTVVFPGGRAGEGASLERCVIGPGASASPGGKYFESVFAGDEGKPIPF